MGLFKNFFTVENTEEKQELENDDFYSESYKRVEYVDSAASLTNENSYNITSNVNKLDTVETHSIYSNSNPSVITLYPKDIEDARGVIDYLKNSNIVLMHINDIEADVAKKILNFCLGGCYALNGNARNSAKGTYIFSPAHITIEQKSEDEQEEPLVWTR